jgi:hypothetical protein
LSSNLCHSETALAGEESVLLPTALPLSARSRFLASLRNDKVLVIKVDYFFGRDSGGTSPDKR